MRDYWILRARSRSCPHPETWPSSRYISIFQQLGRLHALELVQSVYNILCFVTVLFNTGLLLYVGKLNLPLVWLVNAYLLSFVAQSYTQIYVGYLGDKDIFKTRFGRRKPFVMTGFAVHAASFVLLVLPPSDNPTVLVIWFAIFYSLNVVGDSIRNYPYESWIIESSQDNADYLRLKSIVFPIALLLGGATSIVLYLLSPILCAVIYAIGGSCALVALVKYVPNHTLRAVEQQPSIIPSLRIAARTQEFRQIFLNCVLEATAVGMYFASTNYLLLFGFNYLETFQDYIVFTLVAGVVAGILGVGSSIACNWLLQKYDKIAVYLLLTRVLAAIGLVSFVISSFMSETAFFVFFALYVCVSVAYSPLSLILRLFTRDLVTFDTFVNGMQRETLFLTALNTPSQIIVSFLTSIPAAMLTFTKFKQETNIDDDDIDNNFDWSESTLWVLRVFGPFLLFAIGMLAYYSLSTYHLTSAIADQMSVLITRRSIAISEREGSAADTSYLSSETTQKQKEQFLLHFSTEELAVLAKPQQGKTSRQMLSVIAWMNGCGLLVGAVNALVILAVLFMDVAVGDSVYSTLLVSLFLLVSFYVLYESLRFFSLKQTASWSDEELNKQAVTVYSTMTAYQESLQEFLTKGDVSDLQDNFNQQLKRASFLKMPNVGGDAVGTGAGDTSSHDDDSGINYLPGYKRIFSLMGVIAIVVVMIALQDFKLFS
jgi:Na+/melibiose symporter-like transporter